MVRVRSEERVWTIPGERMKAKKEHRVPLSDVALAVLRKQEAIRVNDYVFAGQGEGGRIATRWPTS